MMNGTFFLGIGCGLICVWGIIHLIPTGSIVKGFGNISPDSRRIITMTWVADGLILIFAGLQVGILTLAFGGDSFTVLWVARLWAVMLVVLAVWTGLTGARTKIVPMKVCPFVKLLVGVLFFVGTLV